jgi:hypothetical protein
MGAQLCGCTLVIKPEFVGVFHVAMCSCAMGITSENKTFVVTVF